MAHFYISTPDEAPAAADSLAPARPELALDMSVRKLQEIKHAQRTTHRQANLRKTVLVYNMFRQAAGAPKALQPAPPPPPQHNGAGCTPGAQHSPPDAATIDACCCGPTSIVPLGPADTVELQAGGAGMDVDAGPATVPDATADEGGVADEQSWFDHCIDKMLTEDDQDGGCQPPFSLSASDDDDDDDEGDDGDSDGPGGSGGGSGCALKRSPQSSIQSLCALGSGGGAAHGIGRQHLAIPTAAASECDRWQQESSMVGAHVSTERWKYTDLLVVSSVAVGTPAACIY
ncbi:hypothetical protein LPJ61_002391 [Coemansia biformis]|uniref:SERTA domain-containing protein n=1 Tax=Coemansia biformis TaxID=1286918 RepID=A0A9W8CWH0_9FUNG|nr:hypothetical protein LPJ61_002391 [Coemansia biformis]